MKSHKTSILKKRDVFTPHLFSAFKKGKGFTPHPFSTSQQGEGYTILEVSIAICLFAMLIALGLLLSMDVWRGSSFQSEQDIILSLMYKARSRAVSNINEHNHGLYINEDGKQYILFEGPDYASAVATTSFDMGNGLDFSPDSPEIVFTARTGITDDESFTMSGQGKSRTFDINPEGGITW